MCAALTFNGLFIGSEMVVDSQFFAFFNGTFTVIENVTLDNTGFEVRVAAVINKFSAAPVNRAIERPVTIQGKNIIELATRADLRLPPANALARVLDNLTVCWNVFVSG